MLDFGFGFGFGFGLGLGLGLGPCACWPSAAAAGPNHAAWMRAKGNPSVGSSHSSASRVSSAPCTTSSVGRLPSG